MNFWPASRRVACSRSKRRLACTPTSDGLRTVYRCLGSASVVEVVEVGLDRCLSQRLAGHDHRCLSGASTRAWLEQLLRGRHQSRAGLRLRRVGLGARFCDWTAGGELASSDGRRASQWARRGPTSSVVHGPGQRRRPSGAPRLKFASRRAKGGAAVWGACFPDWRVPPPFLISLSSLFCRASTT